MNEQRVVALCMGTTFLIIGWFLTTNIKFALWGLSHGRARMWVRMLGQDRALARTRYFFGPLSMFLGLVGLILGIVGKKE
jgi:hypothetical protein